MCLPCTLEGSTFFASVGRIRRRDSWLTKVNVGHVLCTYFSRAAELKLKFNIASTASTKKYLGIARVALLFTLSYQLLVISYPASNAPFGLSSSPLAAKHQHDFLRPSLQLISHPNPHRISWATRHFASRHVKRSIYHVHLYFDSRYSPNVIP